MGGTDSGSCPMVDSGFSGAEPSGSTCRKSHSHLVYFNFV